MSAWVGNIRGLGGFALGLIGLGTALFIWRPHAGLAWYMVAAGVGLVAQRWVSWKPLMIVAVVLVALGFAQIVAGADDRPLMWSAIGLVTSAMSGWRQGRREREEA